MNITSVGLITYHYPHLKTEQVLQRLLHRPYRYRMYALPFNPRTPRRTVVAHRPEQSNAVAPEILAARHGIPYVVCRKDTDIDGSCDVYLILGAGILSPACVSGKSIVNCHPGILPASRGLDSFKWAIDEMKPLGVTLHYIDVEVDAGEIIAVVSTNVYVTDSLTTLARRHYENEIACLADFDVMLEHPQNEFAGMEAGQARMRMPPDREQALMGRLPAYLETYGARVPPPTR